MSARGSPFVMNAARNDSKCLRRRRGSGARGAGGRRAADTRDEDPVSGMSSWRIVQGTPLGDGRSGSFSPGLSRGGGGGGGGGGAGSACENSPSSTDRRTLRQSALPSDSEAAPSSAAFSSTACFTVRARACFFFFLMRRVLPVRALRWSRGGASSSKRSLSCAREFARTVSHVSTSAGASDTIAVTQSGKAQPNRANISESFLGSPSTSRECRQHRFEAVLQYCAGDMSARARA